MFVTVRLKLVAAVILTGTLIVLGGCLLYQPEHPVFSQRQEAEIPILMYHHILKDSAKRGKYVIGPEELEQDLIYLKENGYETVTVEDVIRFVYEDGVLPEKPVMLTFDDGYYSNFVYACPQMKKYGMRGVLSVVGEYTDEFSKTGEENANYSYVTWSRCREMMKDGTMELQNHTYAMHRLNGKRRGCGKCAQESAEEYQTALFRDLSELQKRFREETGYLPRAFVYPFGIVSAESDDVLKELGFLASFTSEEGMNVISRERPEDLYRLKRYLRPSGVDSSDFFRKILKE